MTFVGIDLGTTNSAISSFDGEDIKIYKSPEQYDVTPSVLYFDKRGNKYVGSRAYYSAIRNPSNAAMLFKRFMGTNTKIKISALNKELTPEECSAEILKTLYGYIPEDIRNNDVVGTVITVPAAFNQMQKDATMHAAKLAGIGKVALMQEPVAAIMSIVKSKNRDGLFLVYDLGGGTLDIAIAESISGKINLLAHGGLSMCGGRDFDRALIDNIVKPWLFENFNLPKDLSVNPKYKMLMKMATWASEKAKIELSSKENAIIGLSETELNLQDLDGEEIYIDIPITRKIFNELIEEKVYDSIEKTHEILEKSSLSADDIEKIIFIGGPTQYKPLRDMVSYELGIATSIDVNPMTAVSEGAALFAEAIDWSTENRSRKKSKKAINIEDLDLKFNYIARTSNTKSKVQINIKQDIEGYEFQIDSIDTGWTSGKMELKNGNRVELPLLKSGDNTFQVFVFDSLGNIVKIPDDKIIITKTTATVDAIPASSSIGVEVKDKSGGKTILDYLVREGEKLPKKGQKVYKAEETLKAGSNQSLRFKLWEGEIADPITDNQYIGIFEIKGADFDFGVIPAGAELIVDYEILDSGNIILEITVPSIGSTFKSGKNFYVRQDGQIDYTTASKYVETEANKLLERINEIEDYIYDERIEHTKEKVNKALSNINDSQDPEVIKMSMEEIQEAKKIISKIKKENITEIRKLELNNMVDFFQENLEQFATNIQRNKFYNLHKSAQKAIDSKSNDFELYIDEMRGVNFDILWQQDWFIINRFKYFIENDYLFPNKEEFNHLSNIGLQALENGDMDKLREIVAHMYASKIGSSMEEDIYAAANIVRG